MTTDLVEVSRDMFFAVIGPLDVHPRPTRDCSIWEMRSNRAVVGVTTPGYMCQGQKTYKLARLYADAASAKPKA